MSKKTQIDWDLFYLRVARAYALGSKDPSTKVGALLVDSNHRLRSAGYNNFDADNEDNPEDYDNRDTKLKYMKHAEIGCIEDFPHSMDHQFTLYAYPFTPCIDCAKSIVEDGRIRRVVSVDYVPERWKESFELAKQLLTDNEILHLEYPITKL